MPDGEVAELFEEVCGCETGQEHERLKVALLGDRRERLYKQAKARLWGSAGIPPRFQGFTLQSSPVRQTHPDVVARLAYPGNPQSDDEVVWEEWRQAVSEWRGSWFFWGGYGTGKTGLAVGYAYEWVDHEWGNATNGPLYFRSVPRLLGELRGSYQKPEGKEGPGEQELIERYGTCPLLILDDLGAEQVRGTGWVEDRLYQIIGERHGNLVSTVFTSNLNLQELADRIGERVAWRILEMCGQERIVHLEGPNLRDLGSKP